MSSVGETLRRERLRAGLELEKIAHDTKISVHTLELIESDQFGKLPGGVFARSFVRQYARAVGIDEEEILRDLEPQLAPAAPAVAPAASAARQDIQVPRMPRWGGIESRFSPNSSVPALILVVLVILACSGAYTWWQSSRRVTAGPEASAAVESAPAPAAPMPAPAHAQAVNPPEPAQQAAATTAATPGSPTASPVASPADAAPGAMHLALTAAEATWVRATANGKVVFSGILQPNETKSLEAADRVTLRIGNAGGLSINLNGKSIPAVGPKGQVRVVQLSPDGAVQVEAPVKPQPAPAPPTTASQTQTL